VKNGSRPGRTLFYGSLQRNNETYQFEILYALLAALPLAYLAIFYFYPLIKILTVSFIPDDAWGPGNLKKLVTSGIYVRTLWFTTWQAAGFDRSDASVGPARSICFRQVSIPGKRAAAVIHDSALCPAHGGSGRRVSFPAGPPTAW
jgi:ABC-type Fe3+ transport system permease subunit